MAPETGHKHQQEVEQLLVGRRIVSAYLDEYCGDLYLFFETGLKVAIGAFLDGTGVGISVVEVPPPKIPPPY